MRIQSFFSLNIFMLVLTLFVSGCNKNENEAIESTNKSIVGSSDLLAELSYLSTVETKSGTISEEEIMLVIEPMFTPAIEYLYQNGYDYKEDFQDDDPNIIMTALMLLEYDLISQNINVETKSVWEIASCVFLGERLGELSGTGAALLAKRFAKKLLIRAIPYVGVAVGVASAGACIYSKYN